MHFVTSDSFYRIGSHLCEKYRICISFTAKLYYNCSFFLTVNIWKYISKSISMVCEFWFWLFLSLIYITQPHNLSQTDVCWSRYVGCYSYAIILNWHDFVFHMYSYLLPLIKLHQHHRRWVLSCSCKRKCQFHGIMSQLREKKKRYVKIICNYKNVFKIAIEWCHKCEIKCYNWVILSLTCVINCVIKKSQRY